MFALLLACATLPLPEPSDAMVAASPVAGVTVTELLHGRQLLQTRCGNCHAVPHPDEARSPDWSSVYADMARRARLSSEDARWIDVYMRAAAAIPAASIPAAAIPAPAIPAAAIPSAL